jgi:DnaJ-class molecular chaperone
MSDPMNLKRDLKVKDYYKILGIDRTASTLEIKEAYKQLAKIYHPDLNPNSESIKIKFAELTEAYNILGNLENRLKYSMLLSRSKKLREQVAMADYSMRKFK